MSLHILDQNLMCDGVRLADIAAAHGTPTFVYSADHMVGRYRVLATALAGLDTNTRNEVFELFPELRSDYGAYGQAARLSLSVSESACLVH